MPLSFEAVAQRVQSGSSIAVGRGCGRDAIPRIRAARRRDAGQRACVQAVCHLQYTQASAKQRVLLEEVNSFTEAGVPLIDDVCGR